MNIEFDLRRLVEGELFEEEEEDVDCDWKEEEEEEEEQEEEEEEEEELDEQELIAEAWDLHTGNNYFLAYNALLIPKPRNVLIWNEFKDFLMTILLIVCAVYILVTARISDVSL